MLVVGRESVGTAGRPGAHPKGHAMFKIPEPSQRQRGFTLIELMIVVAIISILASLAIPRYLRMQLMSRRSEMAVNLKGIAVAEIAYEHLYESYVDCQASPTTPIGRSAEVFDPTLPGWDELGWGPDGQVRCHYDTAVFTNSNGQWVRAITECDIDGDNVNAIYWMDVDPRGTSGASQHMTIRASPSTLGAGFFVM